MPTLEKYEAIKFHRAMKRGFTSPFLISAVHETTGAEEVLQSTRLCGLAVYG